MPNIKNKQKLRSWQPKKEVFEGRVDDNMSFYNSKAWRSLRLKKLNHNPFCEHCLKENKVVEAKVVDHIQEINQGGEKLNMKNLQSLCHSCHNRKTGKRESKK